MPPGIKADTFGQLQKISLELRTKARPAVDRFKLLKGSLPMRLGDIDLRIAETNKNRAELLVSGGVPDAELKTIGSQKEELRKEVKAAERQAFEVLGAVVERFRAEAVRLGGPMWSQWNEIRRDALALLDRLEGLDQHLGLPAEKLSRIAEKFVEEAQSLQYTLPSAPPIPRIRTPRIGSRADMWSELATFIAAARAALR